jgi:hypothetical protein
MKKQQQPRYLFLTYITAEGKVFKQYQKFTAKVELPDGSFYKIKGVVQLIVLTPSDVRIWLCFNHSTARGLMADGPMLEGYKHSLCLLAQRIGKSSCLRNFRLYNEILPIEVSAILAEKEIAKEKARTSKYRMEEKGFFNRERSCCKKVYPLTLEQRVSNLETLSTYRKNNQ